MGSLGGNCVQGCVRSPHPAASVMRLRGGRSLGGAGQGASHGADTASAQGVQLPLLRNVLDFATSLTASSNASSAPQIDRLDPERMAFLRDAFAEMLENTTDVFATAISRLALPEDCEANISLKERALAAITERVEQMDLAEGLLNMGGLAPSIACLSSNHSIIRQRAAEVLAAAVQNLEKLQEAAHSMGALDRLTAIYANRDEAHETRSKSLHAISALIQGNSSYQLRFLFNQGLAMMRCDMQIGHVRIRRKALFLLAQLLRSNAILREAVLQIQESDNATAIKGVLPELVRVMTIGPEGEPDSQIVEFAISAIRTLVQHTQDGDAASPTPRGMSIGQRIREQFPHLLEILQKRIDFLLSGGATEESHDVMDARQLLVLIH